MRKDVKLGLAIGAILLALVVIYLTVLPSGNKGAFTESPPPVVTQTPAPVVTQTPEPAMAPAAPALSAPTTAPSASAMPLRAHRDWNLLLNDQPAAPAPALAAEGAPSTTQPSGQATYTVKPGQNYSKISIAVYGTPKYYLAIQRANPKLDARKLRPGMVINLPDIGSAAPPPSVPPSAHASPTVPDAATAYPVQPGDSLYKIAAKLYGKPSMADKIYQLNKAAIGDDMAKLRVGMVLKLPAAPAPQS